MAQAGGPGSRIPPHRDPRVRALFFQAVALAAVVWFVYTVIDNTITNLEARGIKTGVSFMNTVAPFALPLDFSPFIDYTLGESKYWRIFVIGIQNTVIVSVLGIAAATVLGFFIGIVRLSPNWLLSRIAGIYVEVFRNTPLLLQLLFWNFAVFLDVFPAVRDSWTLGEGVVVNKVGLILARPEVTSGAVFAVAVAVFVGAVTAHIVLRRRAKAHLDRTGEQLPVGRRLLLLWAVSVAVLFVLVNASVAWEAPTRGTFTYEGGMTVPLPAFVLWFALTVYTAAFIAENVRGGILSVSKGQTEAAMSLGFHWLKTLELIIIPQAMRVIIPPTISQYLNLTKNSSLAVAVAYPELVNVWAGIALNQTGQALIIIAMTIAVYEMLSMLTSAALNYYNSRVQLTER